MQFLNLQYILCLVYSLVGGKCAVIETPDLPAAPEISFATSTPQSLDFWGWLFGGASGASSGAAEAAQHPNSFSTLWESTGLVGSVIGGTLALLWAVYSAIAYTISGILILLLVGALVGLFLIRSDEAQKFSTLPPRQETAGNIRSRWQQLLDRAISTNPKEWRTAILEADVMLGELFEKLGYRGKTTAERLRAIPEGAFVTLPNAWEAHRIRNFVEAATSDYILTQREAFRVMKLYEQVFEEFNFI